MIERNNYLNAFSFTVDVDWAPDFMIDEMALAFTEHKVKCTWFVTHSSPAIDRLKQNALFELGIHPNFLPGSSHGATEDEVMEYCMRLLPEAKVVRTHALYQNSGLLWNMSNRFGIEVDCSLFLPNTPNIIPHTICHSAAEKPLVRVPFYWEDDVECLRPNRSWNVRRDLWSLPGIKTFNFHPFYVGINETDFKRYTRVKTDLCKTKKLYELTREELEPYMSLDKGVGTFFRDLLREIYIQDSQTYWPTEIAAEFLRESRLGN
jgi:hypothetical protein